MFKYCTDANIIFYFFEVYSFIESFMILIWTKPTIFSPPQNTHTHTEHSIILLKNIFWKKCENIFRWKLLSIARVKIYFSTFSKSLNSQKVSWFSFEPIPPFQPPTPSNKKSHTYALAHARMQAHTCTYRYMFTHIQINFPHNNCFPSFCWNRSMLI